jgi:hypothetical protein
MANQNYIKAQAEKHAEMLLNAYKKEAMRRK